MVNVLAKEQTERHANVEEKNNFIGSVIQIINCGFKGKRTTKRKP